MKEFEYDFEDISDEDLLIFDDDFEGIEEPAIAWCNGNGLGKSEVIEYLENVVEIQTNQEECNRIMEGLDEKYRDAAASSPAEPVRMRAEIKLKKGIIGIIVGLAICNIWIDSMVASLISTVVLVGSIGLFFVKPVVDSRRQYAADLRRYNAGTQQCQEIMENCRDAYGVVRTIGESCGHALTDLYNTEIIKPKYRNLPACAFILEQLKNDLTNNLTFVPGDKGAYNKWEEQLYRNAVIGNLDEINGKIDDIRGKMDIMIQNQHLLYDKVNEVNQNVNRVVGELVQIKSLTALTAMNTNQMKHTLRNIEGYASGIYSNSEATAWAAHCLARNTSSTISQDLRYKTGLDFNY